MKPEYVIALALSFQTIASIAFHLFENSRQRKHYSNINDAIREDTQRTMAEWAALTIKALEGMIQSKGTNQ